MNTATMNPFCGRIAASRARSFLAYPIGMSRHSLRGSLRFIPQRFKQAIHVVDARKNKFPEVSNGSC
jgi:hypothetical protein